MKQEKKEERLAMILDAAEELFRDYGFKRTSLEDVAARAGVGKATLYHYVEGKSELFGEVLQRFHRRYLATRTALIDAEPTAIGRLRKFAETFLEQHDAAIKLLAPRAHEMEEHMPLKFRYIRAFREKEKELIESILEFGIEEGAFRDLDVPRTASIVELAVKGVLIESMLGGMDVAGTSDLLVDVLLNGIEKR